MRELVPLTNAVAARVIASALSGCGGNHAILGSVRVSVPTAADGATEAATVNAQVAPAAKSAAEAKAASPAMTVPASTPRHGGYSLRFEQRVRSDSQASLACLGFNGVLGDGAWRGHSRHCCELAQAAHR